MRIKYQSKDGTTFLGFRFGYDCYPNWFKNLIKKKIIKVYEEDGILVLEKNDKEKYKVYSAYIIWAEYSDMNNENNLFVVDKALVEKIFEFNNI